ncbi:DUF547 domain-containing protein [Gilvimarinus japonicus]|uniref:DUF547 domain-containing protein n=1 Tax=Gilvimarinus japonicus TaxID=1796469 RepID=A0ABV7HWC2_9GAMM
MKVVFLSLALWLCAMPSSATEFDHQHSIYAKVLANHVHWEQDGVASRVAYADLKANPSRLTQYIGLLEEVTQKDFERWSKPQQLAFLINAYNAHTLQLVITHYPVESIKDIGRFWQSPWKNRFFTLLGESMSLDDLEHDIIRKPGRYNEPRIHFAVNCASVGCPALRTEPFIAQRLDAQLEDSSVRFLRDASRNRYRDGELQVSAIFKWYRQDFERGWLGVNTLASFFLRYADALSLTQEQRLQLENGTVHYEFLPYDWSLNRSRATTK